MQKISNIKTFVSVCLLSLAFNALLAQNRLDSMLIISVGEYKPAITDANKINSNPTINDSTKKLPVSGYGINSTKINTGFDATPIVPAQMEGEPLTKLYKGLVKIGMGTYTTPYGELWYNSLRSKETSYGIRLKHLSSAETLKNYGFSGFSDDDVSLYGKKFLKEHTLSGNFDYSRNVVHFYGYDPSLFSLSRDITAQRFNYFAGNAQLTSHYTKEERYNHDVKLSYYNLSDRFGASENNIKATGMVQTTINKEIFKVNAGVDFYNYKTGKDTVNNTIVSISPSFNSSGDKYHASFGITGTMDVFVHSKFYFYPNADLSYNIFEDIIVPYIGVTGGLQKNSFKTFTDNNPFVLSALQMVNTNRKYEMYGGLKGTLSSAIAYNARAAYSEIDNMPMYVNDTKDLLQNKFDVIYDDTKFLNVMGEVSYQDREKLRINLRGEYFNYKMKTELRAWYTPELKFTLSANYNLQDKITAKVDLFYLGSQFAKTTVSDSTTSTGQRVVPGELKGVLDANIGLEYRYTKKLGFFLSFNNIANFRYYRYSNYPTQRFSVMGGLSYSF